MTRQPGVARRVEGCLGRPVVSTAPVAGGDIATATKVRLTDGTTAIAKTLPHPPPGFFAAEARGLRWLAEVEGGAPVADLLGAADDCVVVRWVEPVRPSAEAAGELGRRLAVTHAAVESSYGLDDDGFIGTLPLPNGAAPTWADFYATRRVLPYLKLARDRGHATPEHAAAIEGSLGRLSDLVPEEGPRRIHGDLWNGNVLWGTDASSGSSTPPRTRVTARPTWRCWRCSGCRTCRRCWRRTPRRPRSPTAGRTASGSTSCTRCSCTRACSAAATPRARRLRSPSL